MARGVDHCCATTASGTPETADHVALPPMMLARYRSATIAETSCSIDSELGNENDRVCGASMSSPAATLSRVTRTSMRPDEKWSHPKVGKRSSHHASAASI